MSERSEELKLLQDLIENSSSREELDSNFKSWRLDYLLPLRQQISSSINTSEKKRIGQKFQLLSAEAQQLYSKKKEFFSSWALPFYSPREVAPKNTQKIICKFNNLLSNLIEQVVGFLQQDDFLFYSESEIVSVSSNFDSLLIPEGHPARCSSDSFFLDYYGAVQNPSDPMMLRTHTTTTTLSILNKNRNKCIKGASIGSVYRKEDNNSTHLSQFTQLDLVWVLDKLGVQDLRQLIENLLSYLIEDDSRSYRLRPSYFPFTSPSYEVDLSCTCKSKFDCKLCKGSGWIEILGCGFLRSEILNKTHFGKIAIAAGLGLERILMIKHELRDIREIYKSC